MRKPSEAMVYILLFLMLILFAIIVIVSSGWAEPIGVTVGWNTTETAVAPGAANSSAEGGSISTVQFNVSQQSSIWKGYVGNITGQLSLQDSDNYTLYDWSLTSFSGEVYASRGSTISWNTVNCSNTTMLEAEDALLGIPAANIDSVNSTFKNTIHSTFSVGAVAITNSSCPSIATNINGTSQILSENADFQEIAIDDDTNIVFVTLLEQDQQGFDSANYDFQMIIPDSYSESTQTTYYFWAELV